MWRRLLVPGAVRMTHLSGMLIAAMGWNGSHMHDFRVGDTLYGMHVDDYPEWEIDEKEVTVLQALRDEQRFIYDYDFGDGWEHEVVIESHARPELGIKYAVCIEGENACPPDDVGGPVGYAEFLRAIADPNHPEHGNSLEWIGGAFDPARFDLAAVNAALQKIR